MCESMAQEPTFPILVKWEDGSIDEFGTVPMLETDLEVFDSEKSPECEVTDALGRPVRLRINNQLVLKELRLI